MKKQILMIGFAGEKGRRQRRELKRELADRQLKIAVRPVPEADYGRTLGDLAGLDSEAPQAGTSFHLPESASTAFRSADTDSLPRLLIMCGLDDEERELMLSLFSKVGISREDLKAILTPVNSAWTVCQLAAELRKEHAAMKR